MMSTLVRSFYLCCSRFFNLISTQVLQSTLPSKFHTKMHSAILQSSLISRLLRFLPASLIKWRRASFIALKSGTSYHGRCRGLASPLRNYLKTKKLSATLSTTSGSTLTSRRPRTREKEKSSHSVSRSWTCLKRPKRFVHSAVNQFILTSTETGDRKEKSSCKSHC